MTLRGRILIDKIGVRAMVMETDPDGNFFAQGYELASGRDWARLGNLYLQRGVWNGDRILPEGYVKFVSTVAPAWQADQHPGLRRLLLDQRRRWTAGAEGDVLHGGAGGQMALIIPSHDLVVVRLGH